MWTAPPSTGRSPPLITRFRYLPPSTAIRLAIARFAWASSAVILSSIALAFSGSDSLTSTSTFGVPGERVESELIWLIRSSGRISAARTSPDSTFVDRFVTGVDRTHSTLSQMRCWTLAEGSFGAAEADPRVRRHFVEEGDPRLFRPARDREADQDRDQHRVEDQQHRLQRRAAEDLQVLEQQPAHRSVPPVLEVGDEGGLEVAVGGGRGRRPRGGPPRGARRRSRRRAPRRRPGPASGRRSAPPPGCRGWRRSPSSPARRGRRRTPRGAPAGAGRGRRSARRAAARSAARAARSRC